MRTSRAKGTRTAARGVIVAGGAALCLAVAGCGSSGHTAAPAKAPVTGGSGNAVLAAYTSTVGTKTARITFKETISSGNLQPDVVNGAGAEDLDGHQGELVVSASGGRTKEIVDLPEIYLEPPSEDRSQIPGGKSWISVNLNTVAEAKLGTSLSQLSSSAQGPSQTLSYLEAVSNGVRRVGTARISGVATTEYDASVNLAKVAASRPTPQARAQVQKLETALHATTLPMTVWIDGQHRLRQLSDKTTVAGASGSRTTSVYTLDLSDFGVPVHATAPPASQTYDATSKVVKAS